MEPIGPAVGTAPQATRPPRSRNAPSAPACSTAPDVEGQGQDLRTGLQHDPPVGQAAAVQTGDGVRLDGGQRARDEVDGAVRVEREAGVHRGGEARLVEEHHERRHRSRLLRGGHQGAGPRPHG